MLNRFAVLAPLLMLFAAQRVRADLSFNQDIRPILAEACFHCHGPDPGTREAGLRLDMESGFFDPESGPTVVKGDADKSPLYQRLISNDLDEIMPPPESHKELKPAEIALIKKWIDDGAVWQPHWSFVPPVKSVLPVVANPAWVRNEVDQFVLAKLDKAGLTPAQEADPYTLARRVALDLTGLPPAPEVLDAFIRDCGGNPGEVFSSIDSARVDIAYEKLIDQLIDTPQYGEHRARYWLDAARYADTHGLHFDNYREMWPYRDWVVSAFQKNMPFDQFTTEQIAGDLLPSPTTSQLIATGFQRCNITTNEGGTIDEENLALYAADRVQTLGWVYLGLTTNCAQCHDHKFDPITQRDFYSLAAFFRNTTQPAKDGNVKDGRGPALVVPSPADAKRWEALPGEITAATQFREERRLEAKPQYGEWLASASTDSIDEKLSTEGLDVHLPLNEGVGNEVTGTCVGPMPVRSTGKVVWSPKGQLGPAPIMKLGGTFDLGTAGDFEHNQAFSYGAWVRAGRNGVQGGIIARMDEKDGYRGWDLYQADRAFSVHLVDRWPDKAILVTTRDAAVKPGTWQHVFVTYDGTGKAAGIKMFINGKETKLVVKHDSIKPDSSIRTKTALRVGQRSDVQVFDDGAIQDVRVYTRKIDEAEIARIIELGPLRAILAAASDQRTADQKNSLYDYYLSSLDEEYRQRDAVVKGLEKEQKTIENRSPVTHVQKERTDKMPAAFIMIRGQYDNLGPEVPAAAPSALHPLPKDAPQNRLGLAQWLNAPENPLTSRVTVNRFWQEIFGKGLVTTAEDFGIMGAEPTHPELLDWLAVEFRENGWNVKQLMKRILTSSTYRQAAVTTPEKLEKDRDNLLISRGPRFRMDAEMIRDQVLAVSSTLSTKMGGPGTKPYQPSNIWEVVGLGGGNTRDYQQAKGEDLYRRTIYNFWKRMAHSPNMDIFNAPSREACTVRRERTNTPLQALVTLNDIQFVEAARRLAERVLTDGKSEPEAILRTMILLTLHRPIRPQETQILLASFRDMRHHYETHPDDAAALVEFGDTKPSPGANIIELAAWTMVANQILNLDEILNK